MILNQARLLLILACMLVAAGSRLSAGEAVGLKLLRPDSLVGWEHGPQPPSNWIISGGQLSGNTASTPLVSGWTFSDFELRFQWSVRAGGAWNLAFPDVPAGPGLRLTLQEGDGCGAIHDQERTVAGGAKIDAATADAAHTADVRRSNGTLSVIVDGRVVSETRIDPNRRFGLSLSVPAGEATLSELRLDEPRGNPIFNKRDLSGWWAPDNKGDWAAEGDDLVCVAHRGLNYLRTDKEYANFTFSFEYNISRGGNSGIGIRTARTGWPSGDGMELHDSRPARRSERPRPWRSTATCRRWIGPTSPNNGTASS